MAKSNLIVKRLVLPALLNKKKKLIAVLTCFERIIPSITLIIRHYVSCEIIHGILTKTRIGPVLN